MAFFPGSDSRLEKCNLVFQSRENWRRRVVKKTSIAETVLGDPTHCFLFVCIDIILETLTSALRITVCGSFLELKLHRLSSVFGQDAQHLMSQRSSELPFGTKITMEKCLSKHPSLLLGARASATKVCSLLTGRKKRKGVTNAWNKPNPPVSKCKHFKPSWSVKMFPYVQSVRSLTRNL